MKTAQTKKKFKKLTQKEKIAKIKTSNEKHTQEFIKGLEETLKWNKPWKPFANGIAKNAKTGRCYSGDNIMRLSSCSRWATYQTWQSLGAQVRKGEKATPVPYWKVWSKEEEIIQPDGTIETEKTGGMYLSAIHNLFSADQVDGYENPDGTPDESAGKKCKYHSFFEAQNVTTDFKNIDTASYIPILDRIQMPTLECFENEEEFVATLAHEHLHAVGHDGRLGEKVQPEMHRYHSSKKVRALNELVAELCGSLTSSLMGYQNDGVSDNHKAYINSWIKYLKQDEKALMDASKMAFKGFMYMQDKATRAGAGIEDLQFNEYEEK
jgi:putative DNA primase/helicase